MRIGWMLMLGVAVLSVTATGIGPQEVDRFRHVVNDVAFSPSGESLAVAVQGGVQLYSVPDWEHIGDFPMPMQHVYSVSFSSDGKLVATGTGGRVDLWEVATQEKVGSIGPFLGNVMAAAFVPDRQQVLIGTASGEVVLWPVGAEVPVWRSDEGHTSFVRNLAVSVDGTLAASSGFDGTVLWNLETGEIVHVSTRVRAWTVTFSPDGFLLIIGTGKIVQAWDTSAWLEIFGERRHGLWHDGCIWSVAFAPNGSVLASASQDHTIRLWDPLDGRLRATLEAHEDNVWSVAFSPNSRWLASGGGDRRVFVWDLHDWEG